MSELETFFHRITAPNSDVRKAMDSYFLNIAENEIKIDKSLPLDKQFKVKIGKILAPMKPATIVSVSLKQDDYRDSDDFAHMLLFKERIVAVITETRTDSNYMNFSFFKNQEAINYSDPKTNMGEKIKDFFVDIVENKIGVDRNRPFNFQFKIEIGNLMIPMLTNIGTLKKEDCQDSDDFVHMLLFKERVVAVVIETRTDSNYMNFSFFKNQELIDWARENNKPKT